jgi:erythromycin esterase-like protein
MKRYFVCCILMTTFSFEAAFGAGQALVGISRLSSLDFNSSSGEWVPFGKIVGSSSIVALGEANHTNGSFHKAMARAARDLVETKNFRVILLETARLQARILDEYVHDCSNNADPIKGLNLIYPQFASVELEQLFLWLREFNCSHLKDQVTIVGFDVQQGWDESDPLFFDEVVLEQFVTSKAPSLQPRLADLRLCGPYPGSQGKRGPANQEELDQCLRFLNALEPFLRKSAGAEKDNLAAAVIGLRVSATYWLKGIQNESFDGETIRDAGMAKMIKHLMLGQFHEKKAIILAHAGHVGRNIQEFSPFAQKNMGTILGEFFGANYFVVEATSFQPANADWWDRGHPLQNFSKDFPEGILFESNIGNMIVDTHCNSLLNPTITIVPGLPKREVVRRFFDAFIFIPTSKPMTNIPGVTTYSFSSPP